MRIDKLALATALLSTLAITAYPANSQNLSTDEQILLERCNLVYIDAVTTWFNEFGFEPIFEFGAVDIQDNTVVALNQVGAKDNGWMITRDTCTYNKGENVSHTLIEVIDPEQGNAVVHSFKVVATDKE